MSWFNYIGLIFVIIMMIPNIVFGFTKKDDFINYYQNKTVEIFEQIGRYGCFSLMIFNIPYTYYNFWFSGALLVYIIVGAVLVSIYCLGWLTCSDKYPMFRAYYLSVVPSILFIFASIMLLNIPLLICAIIFTIFHITLSVKNTRLKINK